VYADLTGKPTIPTTPGEVGAQPADADLTAIAALAPADGTVLRRIAGAWGAAALAKADVGLGNVDNTADTAKPVPPRQEPRGPASPRQGMSANRATRRR